MWVKILALCTEQSEGAFIIILWGAGGGDYKDFEGRVAFFLCNNIILQGAYQVFAFKS